MKTTQMTNAVMHQVWMIMIAFREIKVGVHYPIKNMVDANLNIKGRKLVSILYIYIETYHVFVYPTQYKLRF